MFNRLLSLRFLRWYSLALLIAIAIGTVAGVVTVPKSITAPGQFLKSTKIKQIPVCSVLLVNTASLRCDGK